MLTKEHTGHEQTIKVFVPIAYFMRFIADVHIKANLDRFRVLIIKAKVRRLFHLTCRGSRSPQDWRSERLPSVVRRAEDSKSLIKRRYRTCRSAGRV